MTNRLGGRTARLFSTLALMLAAESCTHAMNAGGSSARDGKWARDDVSLTRMSGSDTLWRFSFNPANGKPYFNPVRIGGGESGTNFKPADHPWHYGLWFSWKYMNHGTVHTNYWEEDRQTGQATGKTTWTTPTIDTRPDGSARIAMELTYTRQTGDVDMIEHRVIDVSAPDANGRFFLDWDMLFTVGKDSVELNRTPMPGEPGGQVNGGYAGMSIRLAPLPMTVVSTDGPITEFSGNRARPNAAAVAGNFTRDGADVGGMAMLSDPANMGEKAPWYIINQGADFRFIDEAILAPKVLHFAPGQTWHLRYRIGVQRSAWTQQQLVDAMRVWRAGGR
jgi:hypothetical protein